MDGVGFNATPVGIVYHLALQFSLKALQRASGHVVGEGDTLALLGGVVDDGCGVSVLLHGFVPLSFVSVYIITYENGFVNRFFQFFKKN